MILISGLIRDAIALGIRAALRIILKTLATERKKMYAIRVLSAARNHVYME